MSRLPAKFGNVMAENQRTHWDRSDFPRAVLPKQAWEEWFAYFMTPWHICSYLLPSFLLISFSLFLLQLGQETPDSPPPWIFLAFPSPGCFGGSWLRMLFVFQSSLFELFGGKSMKHFKLKLSKRLKSNF